MNGWLTDGNDFADGCKDIYIWIEEYCRIRPDRMDIELFPRGENELGI